MMENSEVLYKIASLEWREFDKLDWDCFAGCESENPMIAEDEQAIYIIDGNKFIVAGLENSTETLFEISKVASDCLLYHDQLRLL